MRGNQRLVLLLFPTFRVLRNPSREFWIATTLKLLKNLFRLWGIFLPNLRILSRKNNESALFTLFRAMSVITSISDRPNVSLVKVWKSIKKRFSFSKKKIQLSSSHKCKIIITNRYYHRRPCLEAWHINSVHDAPSNRDDGGLLPDAYLHLIRKRAAN